VNENNNLDLFKSRLEQLLENMEVPAMRRDLNKLSNLMWLQRNISINNKGEELTEILALLKKERRRLNK
jgi:CBS-domain-containing membrane protein